MITDRRQFFVKFSRSVVAQALGAVDVVQAGLWQSEDAEKPSVQAEWVRPPGALPEEAFLRTCTQCTDCQTACPHSSIRRLGPEFGDSAGTPAIIREESPCYLCVDMPCISVCEPRALLPVEPVGTDFGSAVVDEAKCYAAQGQPCDYCVKRCPLGSAAITFDDRAVPVIDEWGCTGCGVCAFLCPTDAITLTATHRSGKRRTA